MHQGFPPFYNANSKVLILGSFPSVKSSENGFYYYKEHELACKSECDDA